LLSLAKAGFSNRDCLAFDLAVSAYGDAFENAREATKEVPAPKAKKTHTVPAPKYTPAELRQFLGLPDEDEDDSGDEELDALADAILRGDTEIAWGF
jgi:hypothetical protein